MTRESYKEMKLQASFIATLKKKENRKMFETLMNNNLEKIDNEK